MDGFCKFIVPDFRNMNQERLCDEITGFLKDSSVEFTVRRLSGTFCCIVCEGGKLGLVPVPETAFNASGGPSPFSLSGLMEQAACRDVAFIYFDRWCSKGTLIRAGLMARLGRGGRIYARNCEALPVGADTARAFMDANHLYGSVKAKYNFGLFRRRSTGDAEAPAGITPRLVAVASFSRPRFFRGEDTLSYEWVRYASLKGTQVLGGMDKLLKAFIRTAGNGSPFRIVTYADMEWSSGRAYPMLGFRDEGLLPEVGFVVDPATMARIHEDKLSRDRKYRNMEITGIRRCNCGSRRFVMDVLPGQ